ncbi:hypothetical protein I6H46_01380 [Anaerococcus obesiensis]|uniref:Uncharacterized protein n=1 Tax=Anaerococcus obesiensis TaxID=1287640 RepID=A0A7T7UUH3_9FIRM|nr:hypothetical protein [Anaerococcus obesiensis]QQN56309.1 hypothetical protein I6H46_01380 [Anaerococcus obesiensis]
MNKYDISNQNVSMVNTARWRPFDWGFDEDQLNIEKGVYFIDIEGYFDRIPKIEMILKIRNIDIKIDFYEGERNSNTVVELIRTMILLMAVLIN